MESRRSNIIQLAAKLFSEKGYNATSMQEIADAVGIKAASLYNHIESKQEILGELLLDGATKFLKGMDEIKSASLSPLQKVERLIGLHVQLSVQFPTAMALMVEDWRNLEGDNLKAYLEQRDTYEKDFKEIIQDCIDQKYFKSLNIDLALFSMLSTLRWTYLWYQKNKEISPVELEIQLQQYLVKGLIN